MFYLFYSICCFSVHQTHTKDTTGNLSFTKTNISFRATYDYYYYFFFFVEAVKRAADIYLKM